MELNNIGESEHTNSILKIEPGAAVVGGPAAAAAGPAGEVERLRAGVGRHGFLLLALVVLKRHSAKSLTPLFGFYKFAIQAITDKICQLLESLNEPMNLFVLKSIG